MLRLRTKVVRHILNFVSLATRFYPAYGRSLLLISLHCTSLHGLLPARTADGCLRELTPCRETSKCGPRRCLGPLREWRDMELRETTVNLSSSDLGVAIPSGLPCSGPIFGRLLLAFAFNLAALASTSFLLWLHSLFCTPTHYTFPSPLEPNEHVRILAHKAWLFLAPFFCCHPFGLCSLPTNPR